MWFNNLMDSEHPGIKELQMFVYDIQNFLINVLENQEDFGFLWGNNQFLQQLALETYRFDIAEGGVQELLHAIPDIHPEKIRQHGLEGRPLWFKFNVICTIADQWELAKEHFSIRPWFEKLIDAIDALLDSLIDAAGGAGSLIKEFKDALRALA